MVVHDLNHASRYAQHMVAIKKGEVVSVGTPEAVMTKEVLREVFGVRRTSFRIRDRSALCFPFSLAGDKPEVFTKSAFWGRSKWLKRTCRSVVKTGFT